MTTREYHIYLQQQLFNIGLFTNANIEGEELDLVINAMFSNFVRKGLNPQDKADGFEDVQVNVDDLKFLKVLDTELDVVAFARGFLSELPQNYYHLIADRSLVAINCNGQFQTKIVPNRLIDTEKKDQYLDSEISKPKKESPVSELSGNSIRVYVTSDFEIRKIYIDYYRKLNKVDIKSPNTILEFSDETLYLIANKIIENIKITSTNEFNRVQMLKQQNK